LGKRWSKFAVWALSLGAALALFATPAAAEGEADTGAFGAFRLKGSNGYSVLVLAFSKPRFKHGQVLVSVGRGAGRGFENVFYFAPAKVLADKAIPSPFVVGECGVVGIGETSGHGVVGARLVARSATNKRATYLQANKNHQHARARSRPHWKNGAAD
jgi:hypothetical protein